MNALEFRKVNKTYGDFSLSDLDFALPAGAICGLVGENGAGKTTLIRLLLGAARPDSGQITLLGAEAGTPEFAAAREDVGVVLDEGCFPDLITVPQLERVLADTYLRWDSHRFNGYIDRFRLPRNKRIREFSRGMKMKLSIAAALSHQAKLLVLDEATAGLDPIVRDEVVELFREFTREEDHSVLISSHILSDLEKLCDYIAFLHNGQLLFCAEKDAMLEELGLFTGTAEQADSLLPEAVVGREASGYGGVRALVKRNLVPPTLELQRPTVEDVILFAVKGARQS
ncbi:ABC transporter ATP-binding protein [Dysosmobacter sp.]|uniref:ABC transporter ATP-binding protein n=1 Tax=Dysosmobacter sp. TaxID=2591382 RepID=UPI002A8D2C95|nr:ABC transporter ATP-binding protein [Dysosmobacter sp.]MDY3282091.1 ABC transporter ATP-binding protein [Dysosmobacter sp.]